MLVIHSFLLLNDFPLYGYTTLYVSICGALKLFPRFGYCGLCCCEHSGTSFCAGICFHISWVYNCTWSTVAKSCDSAFQFLRNSQTVSQTIVQSHQQNVSFNFSTFSLVLICLLYFIHFNEYLVILFSISLIANYVEHLFLCLLAVCLSSLENCLFRSFAYFKIVLAY